MMEMDGDNMGQEHMLDDMEDYDEEDLERLAQLEGLTPEEMAALQQHMNMNGMMPEDMDEEMLR